MKETEKVSRKGNLGKVSGVRVLCHLSDTGNGYIAKFPSHSSVHQDNYLCMDYAEAEYLRLALTEMMK